MTKFLLYADGAAGVCPNGKAVTEQECFQAAQEVGGGTTTLKDTLNVGSWLYTPCGCFIYNDSWIDYKNPVNGNCLPDPKSNLVCRNEAVLVTLPVTDFEVYADGAAGACPDDKAVTEQECLQAAHESATGMTLRDELNVGSWDSLPCGCFIYIDKWIDYKHPINGNCLADSTSNLVCRKEALPQPPSVSSNSFELFADGAAGVCPDGKAVTEQECLEGAHEAVSGSMALEDTLNVGSWDHTPCGCFIYNHVLVDYKNPLNGACLPDPKSNLVCRKETFPEEPIVPETDFIVYPAGTAGQCPDGLAVYEEQCLQAAQEAGTGMTLKDFLNVGSWGFTPCGCFIYNDDWIDYKDPIHGSCLPHPRSNLVCRKEPLVGPLRGRRFLR